MSEPTTEIQAVEPQLPSNELALWAYEARQASLIASSLVNTSFVPASMKGNVHDITGAILAGRELGMQPLAALRSIDIIQGTPALRAVTMRALVQSRGHKIQLVTSTDDLCVMRGRRAEDEDWQEVEWAITRAQRLGLTSKQQWKNQPRTMLVARATSELCRLIAADVILAMPYTAEELEAETPRVTLGEISIDQNMIPSNRVTLEELTDTPHTPQSRTDRRYSGDCDLSECTEKTLCEPCRLLNADPETMVGDDYPADEIDWPTTAEIGATR